MKQTNSLSWKRLWRSALALMLVFSVLLCGCVDAGEGDGEGGTKPAENNSLLGDGDGRLEAQDAVDSLTNIYGALLGALGGNQKPDTAVDMELVLTPGQDLKAQLENALKQSEMDIDLSWLENVGLRLQSGYNGDLMQMVIETQLNGKKLASAEMIMDMVGGMVYVSAPELNDQALGMEVDMSQMQGTSQQMTQMMAEYAEFLKDLPSDKELNAVLTRYLQLAIDTLDAPATGSTELSCGGITQNVTATTYSVTRYNVLDMATNLLTTAKTDAELEKLLDAFSNVVNQIGAKQAAEQGITWTDVDLHQELMNAIDPALEDIADTKANTEDLEFMQLTVYGDDKTQQGLYLRVEDMDVLKLYTLENDNDTVFYMNLSGSLEISGTGTNKGSKVSGEYVVSMHNAELLYLELEDFDTKALRKGQLKGTVRLQLAQALADEMDSNVMFNEDMVVELVFDVSGKTAKVDVNLYADQILLFGITLKTKTGSLGKVKVPSSYINVQDADAMEQWAQGLKFNGVLANLRAAGVPNDLVDKLEQAIEDAMSGGGEQPYPDYGY